MNDSSKAPQENPLIRGLLNVSLATTAVVTLMLMGTFVAIYYVLPRNSVVAAAPVTAEAPTETVPDEVPEAAPVAEESEVVDGKDVASGLLAGEGLSVVKANCLGCHSAKLVTQNRFTREGWHEKIVWMQETQGLWDLGDNEPIILDYLAANYAPEQRASRRQPLANIEWYELKKTYK